MFLKQKAKLVVGYRVVVILRNHIFVQIYSPTNTIHTLCTTMLKYVSQQTG